MKSRIFVVNEETLEEAKRTGVAKIKIPFDEEKDKKTGHVYKVPHKYFVNSVNSMMADMLQIQKGDYVFFWCEKKKPYSKSTISGVYRVISEPYFKFDDNDDDAPFKVMIEEAYHFERPISEYDVLNSPSVKTPLWNMVGKKTSGKSRGSIQITPAEASVLLSMLIDKNPNYNFYKEDEAHFINLPTDLPSGEHIPAQLSIDLTRHGKKQDNPETDRLFDYDIYSFVHLDGKNKLYCEKTLEGLFNQEIKNKNSIFFERLPFDVNKIIWFGNYLPYSLDRTEMDYLIICSDDGINPSHAYVIEFKRGDINKIDEDTHFYRAMLYSKWVNENLFNGSSITTPIVICEKCPNFNQPANDKEETVVEFYENLENDFEEYNVLPVKIYTVDFSHPLPTFEPKK